MSQNAQRKTDLRHLNPHTEAQGKLGEHHGEETSGEVGNIDGSVTKSEFFFKLVLSFLIFMRAPRFCQ